MNILDKIAQIFMQHCPGRIGLNDHPLTRPRPQVREKIAQRRSQGLSLVPPITKENDQ